MVKILKGNGSSEEIDKIDKLDDYNNIIDFKSLRLYQFKTLKKGTFFRKAVMYLK